VTNRGKDSRVQGSFKSASITFVSFKATVNPLESQGRKVFSRPMEVSVEIFVIKVYSLQNVDDVHAGTGTSSSNNQKSYDVPEKGFLQLGKQICIAQSPIINLEMSPRLMYHLITGTYTAEMTR
jgi:hypothetical protein